MPHDRHTSLVLSWIGKAEHDHKAVALLLRSPDCLYDIACFHAQQAAEKYLKALLVFLKIPFSKTHDLVRLTNLLEERVRLELPRNDLDALSQLAVSPRYPGFEEEPQRDQAEFALETAELIRARVIEALTREGFETGLLNPSRKPRRRHQ